MVLLLLTFKNLGLNCDECIGKYILINLDVIKDSGF